MLSKLLGLASIGSALSNLNLTRRFVIGLATVVALTIVAAIIASALLLFGLYECHEVLIRHGLDADSAALLSALIGIVILGAVIAVIAYKIRKLQAIPLAYLRARDVGTTTMSVVRGFYRGLSAKKPTKE